MYVVACRYDRVPLEALLDSGAAVTLVVDAWEATNRPITDDFIARFQDYHVVESFDDMASIAALATRLADGPPIDKILSLAEYGQFGAAYLATALGHPTPAVRQSIAVRDKRAMKQRALAAGIPCARQVTVDPRADGQLDLVQAVGFPCVLKPAAGMGTVDTWTIDDRDDLARRLAELAAADSGLMVAEEFITGDEYHVDAIWSDGELRHIGIGRYLVPRIEITTPGRNNGSALLRRAEHPETYAAIEKLSRQLSEAFDIGSGITHAEFFQTPSVNGEPSRWVFSEIATRPGGGAITNVYRHLGADLRQEWIRTEVDPAHRPELAEPPAPYLCWINIAPTSVGVVRSAPTEEQVLTHPYVLGVVPGHRPGDEVSQLHPSIWSWMVEFVADDWDSFRRRAEELQTELTFSMEPSPPPG